MPLLPPHVVPGDLVGEHLPSTAATALRITASLVSTLPVARRQHVTAPCPLAWIPQSFSGDPSQDVVLPRSPGQTTGYTLADAGSAINWSCAVTYASCMRAPHAATWPGSDALAHSAKNLDVASV